MVVNVTTVSFGLLRPSDMHIREVASEHALLLRSDVAEESVDFPHDVLATVSFSFLQNPDEGTL